MNEQIFVLVSQKKTTNHILHLLLCILTFGLWLVVWLFVASNNSRHNAKIRAQMNHILGYKMQGMDDVETYRRVSADEAARKKRNNRIFVVSIIVVAVVLFYLL